MEQSKTSHKRWGFLNKLDTWHKTSTAQKYVRMVHYYVVAQSRVLAKKLRTGIFIEEADGEPVMYLLSKLICVNIRLF